MGWFGSGAGGKRTIRRTLPWQNMVRTWVRLNFSLYLNEYLLTYLLTIITIISILMCIQICESIQNGPPICVLFLLGKRKFGIEISFSLGFLNFILP